MAAEAPGATHASSRCASGMADPGATASGMQTATIKTMIRCRPLPPGKKPVVEADAGRQGTMSINHPTRNVEQEFEFDGLFPGETSQEKVPCSSSSSSFAPASRPGIARRVQPPSRKMMRLCAPKWHYCLTPLSAGAAGV